MTEQDKELVFKDLCGRLAEGLRCELVTPEGVPFCCYVVVDDLENAESTGIAWYIYLRPLPVFGADMLFEQLYVKVIDGSTKVIPVDIVRPYLRPMSSMTEREKSELWWVTYCDDPDITEQSQRHIDWLNAHHFDYRGLIEKGLALPAPEGMYDIKTE